MMKKLFYAAFLLIVIVISSFLIYERRDKYALLYASLDPCKKPLTFKVDSVDPRFKLTKDEVVAYSQEAADIWNNNFPKEIFNYSSDGAISINMVFDSRQRASNKINELDRSIEVEKDKLDEMINSHREQVADFKARLQQHNSVVSTWNSQGGAPPEEYDQLIAEQNSLELEAQRLNEQAKSLNLATEDYNLQVGELNEVIDDFNVDLNKKPEEGLFIGEENKIEIYFNNDRDELVHTIAHELGHARDIDHNPNPLSIMYPFSTSVIDLAPEDLQALEESCRKRSPIEVIKTRLNY